MKESVMDKVLDCVRAVAGTMDDHDQRSAIGMARSWVENGKEIVRQNYFQGLFKRRDDLAEALVRAMQDGDKAERVAALREARAVVKLPFADDSMAGFRARRLKLGVVGSEKKAEKLAAKS